MPKKKVAKRTKRATKRVKPAQQHPAMAMAIVPYQEIAKPEMHAGKLSMVPTPFTDRQLQAIVAPTPAHIIKKRPGKGGGEWDYIPGWWFKKKLNFVFGFGYDFEILGERVDGDFITVKGQLTVKDPKSGQTLAVKNDYGGAEVKYHKNKPHTPVNYLDISNDFKAAATDALKRCAVQLGFAMDVYGKAEAHEVGQIISNAPTSQTPSGKKPVGKCGICKGPITEDEVKFSKRMFPSNPPICTGCSKSVKEQEGK